eukprot:scaffold1569_cov171-Amphora_coffeaeformis.AAC.13
MVVHDEADKSLVMRFEKQCTALLRNIRPDRQAFAAQYMPPPYGTQGGTSRAKVVTAGRAPHFHCCANWSIVAACETPCHGYRVSERRWCLSIRVRTVSYSQILCAQ